MELPEELKFIVNGRMPQKKTTARIDGRVCVITGTTSGVGLAAARRIAKGGADLILVCRNQNKASIVKDEFEKDYQVNVNVVIADFADLKQVRRASSIILENYPRIDFLINNIGIHNTSRKLSVDEFEAVFQVNHLASFLFTRLLLNRVLESSPSRILYVNSEGHRFGGLDLNDLNWLRRRYSGFQSYGASKIAQLLTIWELSEQLAESGMTINAMHPGGVRTNIGMNNGLLYRFYQRYFLYLFLSNTEISAEAIYYLIASPELDKVSGKFFNQTIEEKPAIYALDREIGKKVWKISEQLTGLTS